MPKDGDLEREEKQCQVKCPFTWAPDSQFMTGASLMAVPRGPPWRWNWEEGRVRGGFSVPLEMCWRPQTPVWAAGRPHGLFLPAKALCEKRFLSIPWVSVHLVIISVDGLSSIMVCLAQDKNAKHNSTCGFRDIRKSGCPCPLPSSYSKNSTTNVTLLWFLSRWVTVTLTGRWVWPFPKIETKGEGCIGREDV